MLSPRREGGWLRAPHPPGMPSSGHTRSSPNSLWSLSSAAEVKLAFGSIEDLVLFNLWRVGCAAGESLEPLQCRISRRSRSACQATAAQRRVPAAASAGGDGAAKVCSLRQAAAGTELLSHGIYIELRPAPAFYRSCSPSLPVRQIPGLAHTPPLSSPVWAQLPLFGYQVSLGPR